MLAKQALRRPVALGAARACSSSATTSGRPGARAGDGEGGRQGAERQERVAEDGGRHRRRDPPDHLGARADDHADPRRAVPARRAQRRQHRRPPGGRRAARARDGVRLPRGRRRRGAVAAPLGRRVQRRRAAPRRPPRRRPQRHGHADHHPRPRGAAPVLRHVVRGPADVPRRRRGGDGEGGEEARLLHGALAAHDLDLRGRPRGAPRRRQVPPALRVARPRPPQGGARRAILRNSGAQFRHPPPHIPTPRSPPAPPPLSPGARPREGGGLHLARPHRRLLLGRQPRARDEDGVHGAAVVLGAPVHRRDQVARVDVRLHVARPLRLQGARPAARSAPRPPIPCTPAAPPPPPLTAAPSPPSRRCRTPTSPPSRSSTSSPRR